jgi:exodeoxyribonuclease VII small subunit
MEDLMRENVGEAQNDELLTSLTIEETFEELDNLLDMLEQSDNSLEESFRYFERGMKLVRQCSSQIDKVEKQIFMLSEEEGQ